MEDHNLNTVEKQISLSVPMVSEIPQDHIMDIERHMNSLSQICYGFMQFEETIFHSIDGMRKSFNEIKPFISLWEKYKKQLSEIMTSEESVEKVIEQYYDYPVIQKKLSDSQEELNKKDEELKKWTDSPHNQELIFEKNSREECQRKLDEALSNLQLAIQNKSIAEEKHRQLQVENDRLQEDNKRLSNENDSLKEERDRAIEKYQEKSESVSRLQEDLNVYKSLRGLVADAFKIGANSEKEINSALQTTKKILISCVEYSRDKQFDIQEGFEELINNIKSLQTLKLSNTKLKDELTSTQEKIKEQDSKLYEYELKYRRQISELESCNKVIEDKDNEIKKLKENETIIKAKCQVLEDKATLSSRIISIFTSIDNQLETQINTIINNGNQYENLSFISDFIKQIVMKYNRLVELDKLTQQYELPELSYMSLQQMIVKYLEYDKIKQNHDIYEHFLKELFMLNGKTYIVNMEQEQKNNVLSSFINDYNRTLALCHYFDTSENTGSISLDGWESHQKQMNKSIDDFYQGVSQLTDFSENIGTTAYDKISALPLVQKKINEAIRAAIFSIDFSRKSVEESNNMHATVHELQIQLEKKTHVLEILEKKLYPRFLVSGIEGRRDKLVQDIEFGLEIENQDALVLKSLLGLLAFIESSPEDIDNEILIWILRILPTSLYNFYQSVIQEDSNDIKTNTEIYEIMQQLMNKINKNILHGNIFLAMPRLGDGINLDSMELDTDDKPNIVHAVISWKISNSKQKIIYKAIVK